MYVAIPGVIETIDRPSDHHVSRLVRSDENLQPLRIGRTIRIRKTDDRPAGRLRPEVALRVHAQLGMSPDESYEVEALADPARRFRLGTPVHHDDFEELVCLAGKRLQTIAQRLGCLIRRDYDRDERS